jgi:hypothetical protein
MENKEIVRSWYQTVLKVSCLQELRPVWDTAHSFSISSPESASWMGVDIAKLN